MNIRRKARRSQIARGVALLLVGLYVAALGHHVSLIWHSGEHDHNSCALCLLLHSDVVAAAAVAADDNSGTDASANVKLDAEEAAALEDDAPPAPRYERVAAAPEPRAHTETTAGVDPKAVPNALPMAKLQVLSGAFAGRELELTKALTTLGRPGVQVAAITRRAEGYYIVHVESSKEDDFPLVNGQPIGAQARKLTDNDVVQLAGVKMGFFAS